MSQTMPPNYNQLLQNGLYWVGGPSAYIIYGPMFDISDDYSFPVWQDPKTILRILTDTIDVSFVAYALPALRTVFSKYQEVVAATIREARADELLRDVTDIRFSAANLLPEEVQISGTIADWPGPYVGGDIWLNTLPSVRNKFDNIRVGSEGFQIIFHEAGHTLGLSHLEINFNYSADEEYDVHWSVMAKEKYSGTPDAYPLTPMEPKRWLSRLKSETTSCWPLRSANRSPSLGLTWRR